MGKIIFFNHEARQLLQAGVDELANTVKVTLGPQGPQRRAGAPDRRTDDHQRRRLDRARDRAVQPAEEHGRAVGPRGCQQDERSHRRRDDDRYAARPGHRSRGHAGARGGSKPDAAAPRHRGRDRAGRGRAAARRPGCHGRRRSDPRGHDRRQGGRAHRRRRRRGAGPGRARGRGHDRGDAAAGDRGRVRRGHARRERPLLALPGAGHAADGDGVRGPATSCSPTSRSRTCRT